jgi:hypothetical protein
VLDSKNISIQKAFLVTILLKVASTGLGWWLQWQWSLGFFVPLGFMAVYVWLGLTRRNKEVSDEKFADSCYYLGFIFTITSIIFSLFDLPNIGTKMQDIAVRFGAAMVSTVAGLVVRVYLVSFKRDMSDVVKDAEEALFDASVRFRDNLVLANERLRDFHSAVDVAAKDSVERVSTQVEALSKNHADKLTAFFAELVRQNQTTFTEVTSEVRAATMRLAKAVDNYSEGMKANVNSVETRVLAFTDTVAQRLERTTFPADYFSQQLAQPLAQVRQDAVALAAGVREASASVSRGSGLLGAALGKLRNQASAADQAMESVLRLAAQQQAVLDAAQGQLTTLSRIEASLGKFDALLEQVSAELKSSSGASNEAVTEMQRVLEEVAATRAAFTASSQAVVKGLEINTASTQHVVQALVEAARSSDAVATRSRASIQATESVLRQLSEAAQEDKATAKSLQGFGSGTSRVLERLEIVLSGLQGFLTQRTPQDVKTGIPRTEGLHAAGSELIAPPSTPATTTAVGMVHAAVPLFTQLDPATVVTPTLKPPASSPAMGLPPSGARPVAHLPVSNLPAAHLPVAARPTEPDPAA